MEEFAYTTIHSLDDLRLHDKNFVQREDIKPWLLQCLFTQKGIKIIIERSDWNKIIFRCGNGREKEISQGRKRRCITCPFKIRANFSSRTTQWHLVVVNEHHNHGFEAIQSDPLGTDFFEKQLNQSNSKQNKLVLLNGDLYRSNDHENHHNHHNNHEHNHQHNNHGNHNHTQEHASANVKSTSKLKHRNKSKSLKSKKHPKTPVTKAPVTKAPASHEVPLKHKMDSKDSRLLLDFDINHKDVDMRPLSKRDLFLDKQDEFKLDEELANTLGHKINEIIKQHISMNHMINEDSKSNIIRTLINNILMEHKDTMGLSHDTNSLLKNSVNAWFSTSPSLANNPSANLIPLSPLLNDSDNDYQRSNHSPGANQTTLDSLTLPGISSNFLINGNSSNQNQNLNNGNNFVMPNQLQLLQIQNQNRQLPSFNSIQNSLPLSPNSSNSNVVMFNNSSVLPNPSTTNGNSASNNSTNNSNLNGIMNNGNMNNMNANSTMNGSHNHSNGYTSSPNGNNNSNSYQLNFGNSSYLYTNQNSQNSSNMNMLNNGLNMSLGQNGSSYGFNSSPMTNSNPQNAQTHLASTLNPSHLLKDQNSKNNAAEGRSGNHLLANNNHGPHNVNVNSYLGSLSNILTTGVPGLSSPTNNSMAANQSMQKDDSSLGYKMRNETYNE